MLIRIDGLFLLLNLDIAGMMGLSGLEIIEKRAEKLLALIQTTSSIMITL